MLLGIEHAVFGVVENIRGCDRTSPTVGEYFLHMLPSARTSERDYGYLYGGSDAADQINVVTRTATIAVDRLNQDFTRPPVLGVLCPMCRRLACGSTTTIRVRFPILSLSTGVYVDDDALASELFGRLVDELGLVKYVGIERDFIGPTAYSIRNVLKRSNATSECQWHETPLSDLGQNFEWPFAITITEILSAQIVILVTADIEIDQFIRSPVAEPFHDLSRIPEALVASKSLALDAYAASHQDNRNQPIFKHFHPFVFWAWQSPVITSCFLRHPKSCTRINFAAHQSQDPLQVDSMR